MTGVVSHNLLLATAFLLVSSATFTEASTSRSLFRPLSPPRHEAWVLTKQPSTTSNSRSPHRHHNSNHHRHSSQQDDKARAISKQTFASSIAFLSGIADVFCFRWNRCYANMMTGNIIKMATSLGEFQLLDAFKFASLLIFYGLGSLVFRTFVHYHHNLPNPHVAARTKASPLIVLAFAAADLLGRGRTYRATNNNPLYLPLLSMAFGLLNAVCTDATGGTITFAMTGHVSKLSQGLADWLFAVEPRKRRWRSATKLSAHILSFFSLGVLVGTLLATQIGSYRFQIPESGMMLSSFWIEQGSALPVFTILGLSGVMMLYLYDHVPSLSILLGNWLRFLGFVNEHSSTDKSDLQISFKRWSPHTTSR